MDLKHIKKRLALLIVREMQTKTTLRHHFSPIRLAKYQKLVHYYFGSVLMNNFYLKNQNNYASLIAH